jgi:hypothetical protein
MQGSSSLRKTRSGRSLLGSEGIWFTARSRTRVHAARLRQQQQAGGSGCRRRTPAAAAASPQSPPAGESATPPDLTRLLTSRAFTPAPYVGPVAVQLFPGAPPAASALQ